MNLHYKPQSTNDLMNIDLESSRLLSRSLKLYEEDVTALPQNQPVRPPSKAEY